MFPGIWRYDMYNMRFSISSHLTLRSDIVFSLLLDLEFKFICKVLAVPHRWQSLSKGFNWQFHVKACSRATSNFLLADVQMSRKETLRGGFGGWYDSERSMSPNDWYQTGILMMEDICHICFFWYLVPSHTHTGTNTQTHVSSFSRVPMSSVQIFTHRKRHISLNFGAGQFGMAGVLVTLMQRLEFGLN